MAIYLSLFLYHLLAFVTKNKLLFGLSFLVLFILMAFRGVEVGTDTLSYERIFNYITDTGDLRHIEPLFRWLIIIVKYFGGDYRTFLVVCSLLTLLPIYYIASDFLKSPLLLILLYISFYYYLFSFNILRQGMASSICSLSIYLFIRQYIVGESIRFKTVFSSVVLLLIAVLIHYSCLIVVPSILVFILVRKFKSNIALICMVTFAIIIGVFGHQIVFSISSELSEYDIAYESNLIGTLLMCLLQLALFCFMLFILRKKDSYFYAYVVFLLLFCVSIRLPYSNRAYFPVIIMNLLFFARILEDNRVVRSDRFFINIIVVLYLLLTYLRNLLPNIGEVLPYSFDF